MTNKATTSKRWTRCKSTDMRLLFLLTLLLCVLFGLVNISTIRILRPTPHQTKLFANLQNIFGARDIEQDNVSIQTSTTRKENVQQDLKQRFPECIIIGVMKAGTTALKNYLSIHPQISITNGEPHFFDTDAHYEKGLEHYRNQMQYSYPDQITIEKSPRYFTTDSVPKRIKQFNENIKLIVTLRNPVERVISHFAHHQDHLGIGRQNKTFVDFLTSFSGEPGNQAVVRSMYIVHMNRWLEYFPRKQIHVVDGDNLIVNPIEEMQKVETFLGIKHIITKEKVYFNATKGFYCLIDKMSTRPCLWAGKGRQHPAIDQKLYKILKDFFDIYNKALFDLLGRSFNWD